MRIVFLSLDVYDMLTGGYEGKAGGSRTQQAIIGKELANRGHDVYFVEYDEGKKNQQLIDGIRIVKINRPKGSEIRRGISAAREIVRVLRVLKPDVCYRRNLDYSIIPVSYYCSLFDCKFIYGVAHDEELGKSPRALKSGIKSTRPYRWLNNKALKGAEGIIVQNENQLNQAVELIGPDRSHLIHNCCPIQPSGEQYESACNGTTVLWVSRFKDIKQPDLVVKLAEDLPAIEFVMVGGANDIELYNSIEQKAKELDNVSFEGYVPHAEIGQYYKKADVFLNTAKEEGFPNTFLEAWAYNTPVISLNANPDKIITENEIGFVANGSLENAREMLKKCNIDGGLTEKMGKQGQKYVLTHHDIGSIVDRYESVFNG